MKRVTPTAIAVATILAIGAAGIALGALPNRLSTTRGKVGARVPASGLRAPVALDDRRQQLIGVRIVRVERGTLVPRLRAAGAVTYDETRLTDVNVKVEGWIRELYVNYTGQRVRRDEPLFSLYSPDVASAQTQLIAAIKNRDQIVSTTADAHDYAERFLDTPRQRLQRWDVPDDQLRAIETSRQVLSAVVFRSPAAGVVIEKTALKGMHVEPGLRLYKLGDLSVVWIEAEFHELDVSQLRVGARADVSVVAWPGKRFGGRIVHIYPYMTEATRTIKARIELANHDGRLKPGMFASVEVDGTTLEGLSVPADAVVDTGDHHIVFVADGDGHFEPRPVTVGGAADGRVLVVAGLRETESVAARGTFLLDSESQMRAALDAYAASPGDLATSRTTGRSADLTLHVAPARVGDNLVEVTARTVDGQPIGDAQVDVTFAMPPMPSMNMPPMRSQTHLTHVGDGLYTGTGALAMGGGWEVTVTALREGQAIGSKHFTLVAR